MWLSRDNYDNSEYELWVNEPRIYINCFDGIHLGSWVIEEFETYFPLLRLEPGEIIEVDFIKRN